MSAKIQKVIARQQSRYPPPMFIFNHMQLTSHTYRIEEGDYYEAHQQIRTITNRYVRSADYTSAVDLLSSGASLLLKAGQGGSGADLCVYLIEVYNKAELKPDIANKARLLGLLRAFPEGEKAKKKFVGGIVE